jgi:hypothetical protein
MINPNIPNMPNFPGMGAMTDTLDFVKNLWSGMGIPGMNMSGMNMPAMPGMVIPSLSVEEINKKISDLRAVETWLNLNMNMLRGTIQALEVQSATIATLQTMGETFSASMGAVTQQPAQSATQPAAGNGAQTGNGAHDAEKLHGTLEPTSKDESDAASLTAPLVNAAAWWNMLQDQFKQAVSGAMTAEAPAASAPPAEKPQAKSKPKAAAPAKSKAPSTSTATRKRKTSK